MPSVLAKLFECELVAGECVDPTAQAATALFRKFEQAFRRSLGGSFPLRGDKPRFLHALERAVHACRVGFLSAKHWGAGRLLDDDVAMKRGFRLGKQGENGGLGKTIERFAQLGAFLQVVIRLWMAAAPHNAGPLSYTYMSETTSYYRSKPISLPIFSVRLQGHSVSRASAADCS